MNTSFSYLIGALFVPVLMGSFSIVFWIANGDVPASDMRLARFCTAALFAVSVYLVATEILSLKRLEIIDPLDPTTPATFNVQKMLRPTAVSVTTLILIFGAGADFVLAATAFLLVALLILGVRKIPVLIGVPTFVPVGVFLLFRWVGVPLTSIILNI